MIMDTLTALSNEGIQIDYVLYLLCEHNYLDDSYTDEFGVNSKKRLKDIKFQIENNNIKFSHVIISNDDIPAGKADDIVTIQKAIKKNVFKKLIEINPNSINIGLTSGTREMTFAWISLYATSSFERAFGKNVTLWHFSDDRTKKEFYKKKIYRLDVPENSYIERIELAAHESNNKTINLDINDDVKRNCIINTPMLLLGERGIGKSTIVESTILPSKRKCGLVTEKGLIQTVICGQLDSSLVDDALFGHVKGAFTGADSDTKGAIELADEGILFLDEIHDLPDQIQRKLLRVLQTHEFSKIGEPEKSIKCNFQLVCASNISLSELQKRLHPDFFDRIAVFITELPPLRSLPEDKLEELWNNRWEYCRCNKFILPETPDNFSFFKTTLYESQMYGNIRDIEQLIAYIARDVYKGSIEISDEAKESFLRTTLQKWKIDYNKKYSTLLNNNAELNMDFLQQEKWEGINKLFKKWLSEEAEKIFGSQLKAAEALDCEPKTLRNVRK